MLRIALLVAVFLAHPFSAFAQGRDYSGTIQSGGLTRHYLVHLPPSYNGTKATPVVLALHGGGGTSQSMVRLTHFNDVSDGHGFIVAYPNAYDSRWADGRGTTPEELQGVNDVAFISDLIDHLTTELVIDLTRVYATGISNGGIMSQRLACELSERIAAIAPVAGSMAEKIEPGCQPTRSIPVMLINGMSDWLVPWAGGTIPGPSGGRVVPVWMNIDKWITLNGCSACPTVSDVSHVVDDGTRTRSESYACQHGVEVTLMAVAGGGHTWPGGLQYLPEWLIGRTSRDFDASEVIWEFFQRNSRT